MEEVEVNLDKKQINTKVEPEGKINMIVVDG